MDSRNQGSGAGGAAALFAAAGGFLPTAMRASMHLTSVRGVRRGRARPRRARARRLPDDGCDVLSSSARMAASSSSMSSLNWAGDSGEADAEGAAYLAERAVKAPTGIQCPAIPGEGNHVSVLQVTVFLHCNQCGGPSAVCEQPIVTRSREVTRSSPAGHFSAPYPSDRFRIRVTCDLRVGPHRRAAGPPLLSGGETGAGETRDGCGLAETHFSLN